jgi:hypothetical protein
MSSRLLALVIRVVGSLISVLEAVDVHGRIDTEDSVRAKGLPVGAARALIASVHSAELSA